MKYKHGHSVFGHHSPEFDCWQSFKARCLRKSHPQYPDYGGRGITVCTKWLNSFQSFYDDVGPRPPGKYSLDRIDNDKGYEPGNCKWATRSEQQKNRRYTKARVVEELRSKLVRYEQKYGPLED